MPANNVIASAPSFNLHRQGLVAADAAPIANVPTLYQGVNGRDFSEAVIDVSLVSGTLSSVTLEALYWSDESQKFVSMVEPEVNTLTAAGQFIIQHKGRRFFLHVNSITGTNPKIDLNVAGVRGGGQQYV